ncbi:MAG: pseudaminic acid cytidylyltransferase [Crocinitomicaceae bacterium]|nr:pseudaminic acid cytidylyltransferase [Crocinitomicaceae bacterium]MBK8924892.1 pseudaminic acid cytidylyltransferase [Crocinitomicaceae bacterium]
MPCTYCQNKLKAIAIIPARGGSKRIPGKNIKLFAGKPIIAYSIDTLKKSNLFQRIIVSTDDSSIEKIALQYGAEVPFTRSSENSNDHAVLADVIAEVLHNLSAENLDFDIICCMLATAPFINSDQLIEMSQQLKPGVEAVFTVQQFGFPIYRALQKNNEGLMSMIWPENMKKRSQDFNPAFHDAGQVYFIRKSAFMEQKKLYPEKSFGFEINALDAVDIDTPEDWVIAEKLFELRNNSGDK